MDYKRQKLSREKYEELCTKLKTDHIKKTTKIALINFLKGDDY